MLSIIFNKFKTITPGIYVFLYHSVYTEKSQHPFIYEKVGTSIERFCEHIDLFRSRFEVIRPCDIQEIVKKSGCIEKAYAIITFDDGFQDVIDNAVVELLRCQLPATFFICHRCASQEGGLWRFRLFLMLEMQKKEIVSRLNTINKWPAYNELEILAETKDHYFTAYARNIDEIWGEIYNDKSDLDLFASYETFRKLDNTIFTFGSHTITHPVLSAINSKEASYEIFTGHAAVEEGLGRTVNCFSYPFGGRKHWNRDIERLLWEQTSWLVFSAYGGINFLYNKSEIKRIGLLQHSCNDILKIVFQRNM